jgi:Spy/CpxP family protein refolding chaperone
MALLLMAPAIGSELNLGPQSQSSGGGRGAIQSPPPSTGRSQTPPAPGTPQTGQHQQPSAEQYLTRFDWWKDDAVKKEMKLTDRQAQNIARIFDSRVKEVTPIFEDFQKEIGELDRMTQERTADVAAYALQVSRAEFLRSKLNETRAVMLYTIYRQLDPAQYQKLREIQERRRSGRGGGAPSPRTW